MLMHCSRLLSVCLFFIFSSSGGAQLKDMIQMQRNAHQYVGTVLHIITHCIRSATSVTICQPQQQHAAVAAPLGGR
jgi:hypothetical protein